MTIFRHAGKSTTGPSEYSKFVARWDTTQAGSADDTIVLPLVADGTYNFYIDWGDGNRDTITGYDQSQATHQYSDTGIYTIQLVANDMVGWQFDDSGDDDKLVEIMEWGPLRFVSDDTNLFKGCSNLTLSTTSNPPFNADAAGMFQDCSSLTGTGGDILNWDVSSVTGMDFMLAGCTSLDADLSNWDVSAVKSAEGFMSGAGLSTENYNRILSGWSSQSVQSGVNISFGDVKYSPSSESFRGALTSPENGWNIEDGGSIATKFIATWDTRNTHGFPSAPTNQVILPLRSIGTYDFDVDWGDGTPVQNVNHYDSPNAAHTYSSPGIYTITIAGTLSGWAFYVNSAKLGDSRSDLQAWTDINPQQRKMTCVHDWEALHFSPEAFYQFANHVSLTGVPTTVFNVPASGSAKNAFQNTSGLGIALSSNNTIGGWDTSAITNMYGMFGYAGGNRGDNVNFDIGSWDVSNVTHMGSMFAAGYDWNNGGSSSISGWDTSSVEYFGEMFFFAEAFNQPIGYWDTSSAIWMNAMFRLAISFNQPIGDWDMSNVTRIDFMLDRATSFNQDLGSWDVSSVTNATDFLLGVTLSTANYNSLLQGWAPQSVNNGVNIHFGNSRYSAGPAQSARATLISKGWTITDGGQV